MFEYEDEFLMCGLTNAVGGKEMFYLCSASNTAEDQLAELARLVGSGGTTPKAKPEPITLVDNAPRLEFDLENELSKAFGSVPYSSPDPQQPLSELTLGTAEVVSEVPAVAAELPHQQANQTLVPQEPIATVEAVEPTIVEEIERPSRTTEVVQQDAQSDLDLSELISAEFERALEEEANEQVSEPQVEFDQTIESATDTFESELARLMGTEHGGAVVKAKSPPPPQQTVTPPSEPEIIATAAVPAVSELDVPVSPVDDNTPVLMSDFDAYQHHIPVQEDTGFAHQSALAAVETPDKVIAVSDPVAEMNAPQPTMVAPQSASVPAAVAPFVSSEIALDNLNSQNPPFHDEQISIPEPHPSALVAGNPRSGRRAAGSLVAIALLAGVGLAGWNAIGGGDETVPTILASTDPVKLKPKDAGGKVVPNQDQAVFRSVESSKKVEPKQERLTDNSEKPIVVATNAISGDSKTETRIERNELSTTAGAVLQPRKVRTVVVRPDGTILTQSADVKVDTPKLKLKPESVLPKLIPAKTKSAVAVPAVPTNVAALAPVSEPKPKPVKTASTPKKVVSVKKPAETVKSTASVSSPYAVQVASQRSAEAAERTYKVLARRYASVFRGQGMDIRKADIKGKGIYYRARIPAQTKVAARKICQQLKAKGGDCFVTR